MTAGIRSVLAGVAALLVLAAVALGGGGGEPEIRKVEVGNSPIDIAVGDFNRDGRRDLAVTNFQDEPDTISIIRGKSRGRFAKARTIALAPGDQPHGIAVARLGAGKDQDLVVGTLADNVLLLKGRKGAGFEAPVPLAIGQNPRRVATGDFNGDGRTDLALSRQDADDVAVVLGQGGLGFGPPSSYPGAEGGQILAANVDSGGDLDLVTINFDIDGLSLLRGQSGGGFGAAEPLMAGTAPFSVAVADLNRDGRRDIIGGLVGDRPRLAVARGLPGGTFAAPVTLTVGPRPMLISDIEVTRLNRDRDPDLVLVGREIGGIRAARGDPGPPPTSRVLFLKGRGGIQLRRAREVDLKGSTDAVVAGRFNGGGRDVAVTRDRFGRTGHAVVILNP